MLVSIQTFEISSVLSSLYTLYNSFLLFLVQSFQILTNLWFLATKEWKVINNYHILWTTNLESYETKRKRLVSPLTRKNWPYGAYFPLYHPSSLVIRLQNQENGVSIQFECFNLAEISQFLLNVSLNMKLLRSFCLLRLLKQYDALTIHQKKLKGLISTLFFFQLIYEKIRGDKTS